MNTAKWSEAILLLLCIGFSFAWSLRSREALEPTFVMTDFGGIYFESLSALDGKDPYNQTAPLIEFHLAKQELRPDLRKSRADTIVVALCVYLPTALFLIAPFSLLSWSTAQFAWAVTSGALLFVAALLVVNLTKLNCRWLSTLFACLVLANCFQVLLSGNISSVVVGFCTIAVWCFLTGRNRGMGIVLLSVSLVLKPHDVGFIWLYFLLAGGALRKSAVRSLVVAALIGTGAALWIAPISPHWIGELKNNNEVVSALGGTSDPGSTGLTYGGLAPVIDLQAMFSLFRNDPHFYNPMGYGLGGTLLLIWIVAVIRKQKTYESSLLAIGSVAVLTLLPVYHRPYDAKLLLLTIPACTVLWETGGRLRWSAVALTSLAILVTSDIPIAMLLLFGKMFPLDLNTLVGKLETILLLEPAPLTLLLTGCFYLWAFITYVPAEKVSRLQLDEAATPVTNL